MAWRRVENSPRLKTRAILAGAAPALRAGFGFGFCRRGRCAERTRIDPPRREYERGVATESPSPSLDILACSPPENGNGLKGAALSNGTNEIRMIDENRGVALIRHADLIFLLYIFFNEGKSEGTA